MAGKTFFLPVHCLSPLAVLGLGLFWRSLSALCSPQLAAFYPVLGAINWRISRSLCGHLACACMRTVQPFVAAIVKASMGLHALCRVPSVGRYASCTTTACSCVHA
ncbi:hypothetical protein V6N13_061302 [Hibiscus sabdariffa]